MASVKKAPTRKPKALSATYDTSDPRYWIVGAWRLGLGSVRVSAAGHDRWRTWGDIATPVAGAGSLYLLSAVGADPLGPLGPTLFESDLLDFTDPYRLTAGTLAGAAMLLHQRSDTARGHRERRAVLKAFAELNAGEGPTLLHPSGRPVQVKLPEPTLAGSRFVMKIPDGVTEVELLQAAQRLGPMLKGRVSMRPTVAPAAGRKALAALASGAATKTVTVARKTRAADVPEAKPKRSPLEELLTCSHVEVNIRRRETLNTTVPWEHLAEIRRAGKDYKGRAVQDPWHVGQDEDGKSVYDTIFARNKLSGGEAGSGKALALDTPIPTPSGWTTMGELRTGDLVFDENGRPCRVVDAMPIQHGRPVYRMTFSDGTEIVADAAHEWATETQASRLSDLRASKPRKGGSYARSQGHKRVRPSVVETRQIAATLRAKGGRCTNHSVRVAGALQTPDADLPVGPYTLGAWLGDGDSASGRITCPDDEVWLGIEAEGSTLGTTFTAACRSQRVVDLTSHLRTAGVLGDKHIPSAYLRASQAQRRALLGGLLDTDGHCVPSGTVEFYSTRERLARDAYDLVAGLGYQPTLRSKPATLYGKDCGTCWTVQFRPADKVFTVARKAARQNGDAQPSVFRRFIVDVTPVESVPVRCIEVDSPSHLYLASRAYIPTHNSTGEHTDICAVSQDLNARNFFVDPSGGAEFGFWEPLAARTASGLHGAAYTVDDAVRLLQALHTEGVAALKRMGDIADEREVAGLPRTNVARGETTTWIWIDELLSLTRHPDKNIREGVAFLLFDIIGRLRKVGYHVVVSTLKPTGDVIPTYVRDLITIKQVFRCTTADASTSVLGDKIWAALGYGGHKIEMKAPKGISYLLGAEGYPLRMRSAYVDPDVQPGQLISERHEVLNAALRLRGLPEVPPLVRNIDPARAALLDPSRPPARESVTLTPPASDGAEVTPVPAEAPSLAKAPAKTQPAPEPLDFPNVAETEEVDSLAEVLMVAARMAVEAGHLTFKILQARLGLDFEAAGWVLGELEERGVIAPAEGDSGSRKTLASAADLDRLLAGAGTEDVPTPASTDPAEAARAEYARRRRRPDKRTRHGARQPVGSGSSSKEG